MPDTRPDPLATLLHSAMIGCKYDDEADTYEPDFAACIDHASDARILLSRGVTLTQPQPDYTTAIYNANRGEVTQPQPDAGLRETAQAVVDDWFGTYDPEVRIPSAAENIEALRAALASSPARPTGDTALREAALAVVDRFGGYPRGFWATEDHDALDALAAALRSTPAAPATETPTEQPAPSDGSAVVPLDVERVKETLGNNLDIYQRRIENGMGNDFAKGKAAGLRIALSLLDPKPATHTIVCRRGAALGDKP